MGIFDDLNELTTSGPERPRPIDTTVSKEDAIAASEGELFLEPCQKCRGLGYFRGAGYTRRQCFGCKGKGHLVRKTSPEARAKAKQARKNAQAGKVASWRSQHAEVCAWIDAAAARGFDIARSFQQGLAKYGSLTDKQLAAAERLAAEDARRAIARKAAAKALEATAKVVTVAKIEEAFANARAKGVKIPKLRLDTFRFSPAAATSENAGAIYVKEGDDYLGKIVGGKFLRTFRCDEATEARVVVAASDPEAAAVAYGKRFGSCAVCNRELSNAESIERGIGPICAERFGW
jgi:hypothetical protein